jgi:hypothetical protein
MAFCHWVQCMDAQEGNFTTRPDLGQPFTEREGIEELVQASAFSECQVWFPQWAHQSAADYVWWIARALIDSQPIARNEFTWNSHLSAFYSRKKGWLRDRNFTSEYF